MACTRDSPRERRRDILGNAEGNEAQSGTMSTASGRNQQGRRVAAPGSIFHSRREALEVTSHKGFAAAYPTTVRHRPLVEPAFRENRL